MNAATFKPAWWLKNPHFQTIWPALCRRSIQLELKRERVDLPDGDFIDLDWVQSNKTDGPLVLMLHGFEGSIESHYAKGMLKRLTQSGWRCVFMHFRGCSGEHNRLVRSYHSGDTEDLTYIVNLLNQREPNLHLAAIGYSLGGNVLLKWLGETQKNNILKAAIAVSVPFELHKASKFIQKGFAQFYQWYFIRCLRERLSKKFKAMEGIIDEHIDPSLIFKVSTMYEFDDKITAPLHGFAGVEDYYIRSSSRPYLKKIEVPTLIVHAKDDPFMSQDVIPDPQELSASVKLELCEKGGHVGFVGGKYPWSPQYWLEERVPVFLNDFLK